MPNVQELDKKEIRKGPIVETRHYPFEVCEVRELDDHSIKITGYAAVYNELSNDLGGFRERIKRGFFTPAIGRDDVRALFNHDSNYVLGRTTNNTLIMEEDKKGLKVHIAPPDTSYARDVVSLIRRGDINQMSFQWVTKSDEWDSSDLNNVIRTLVEIDSLWDVSPVTFPAYPQTKAEVNSAKQVLMRYYEEFLEDNPDVPEEIKTEENGKGQERISVLRRKLTLLEKEI